MTILNKIRMNIYGGNLDYKVDENDLEGIFEEYGTVSSAKIINDKFSGKSKGFGFVEMEGHEARAAIAGLNGKLFGDKYIKVNFEEPRKNRGRR